MIHPEQFQGSKACPTLAYADITLDHDGPLELPDGPTNYRTYLRVLIYYADFLVEAARLPAGTPETTAALNSLFAFIDEINARGGIPPALLAAPRRPPPPGRVHGRIRKRRRPPGPGYGPGRGPSAA